MSEATRKVKIDLTGVPETALYTLWIRANDALKPDSKLQDKWAVEAMEKIEGYDFSRYSPSTASVHLTPMRSQKFEKWTTNFLDFHASATVINLACGLDSRALRIVPFYPGVRWIDLDFADMIALRKQLLPNPVGDYKLVASSATDDSWLLAIPADRPTLVIMEGLMMYLSSDEGENLIRSLSNHFSSGQLIFDITGWLSLQIQSLFDFLTATGSTFKWALDDPFSLEKLNPRLKLREVVRHADYEGCSKLPARLRFTIWWLWYVPWARNLQLSLLLDLNSKPN
jgi:O-methyltransferase involved in polyketide biosynthesis